MKRELPDIKSRQSWLYIPQMQRHILNLHCLCNLLFPRYSLHSFLFHFLFLCSNCGAEEERIWLKIISLSWLSCRTNHLLIITSALRWFQYKEPVLKFPIVLEKNRGIMVETVNQPLFFSIYWFSVQMWQVVTATLVKLRLFYYNQNYKHISMEIDIDSWCWFPEKALLYFPYSDSCHSSFLTVSWWACVLPWLVRKCVVFLYWLDSTSGCYTSEHLSCAHPGFPSFVSLAFWNMSSCFLSPHTSPTSPSRHFASFLNTSLHLWLQNVPLIVYFISAAFCSDCSSAKEGEFTMQFLNPAGALAISFCFSRVWTRSWYFPQHPFTRGQSKIIHIFATKVVSAYQCFQHRCISANGTTSAVSCVTMASDWKPLNYYTLDRGTKEDVELFKVP